ncbi:MAG: hypothetical protein NWF10_08410 [Candidatus Bathyarchaeota archaeon]|nr:hypothetical protein [Candidatus Bathyarchaeota archaeon]
MSELTLSSQEIKKWLKNQTDHFLSPIQNQAQKNCDQLQEIKESVIEITKTLLDSSSKEIEKRNMRVLNRARALNKLAHLFSERIRRIKIPETITYANLSKAAKETNKVFLVTDIDIKNWFPRISPFFIRDRRKFLTIHEKAKESLAEIDDFVKNEYIKTKTLQETFQLISDLINLKKRLTEIQTELKVIEKDQNSITTQLSNLTNNITSLEEKDTLNQLSQIETEIINLRKEVSQAFRRLKKPFKKMQAQTLRDNSINLRPQELAILELYIENPFEALAQEKTGYPLLKQILKILRDLMGSGKLKLKSDKKRKAQESIKKISNNSLVKLHEQSVQKIKQKKQLLNSETLAEITQKKTEFKEQTRKIKAKKDRIDAHALVKKNKYNQMSKRIQEHKKLIEKNVYESIEKKIKIEL